MKEDRWLIYRIVFPNGKSYIGLTKDLYNRISCHKRDAQNKVRRPICNAINHFGWDAIRFEEIHTNIESLEEANELEKYYIVEYDSHVSNKNGYNCSEGGDGCSGVKKTPEQIEEFRERSIELWKDPKHRAKMSKVGRQRKGTYSKDIRDKMSKSAKARVARIGSNFKPRRIYCTKLDIVFLSLVDCSVYLNVSASTIYRHINGNTKVNKYKSLSYYN